MALTVCSLLKKTRYTVVGEVGGGDSQVRSATISAPLFRVKPPNSGPPEPLLFPEGDTPYNGQPTKVVDSLSQGAAVEDTSSVIVCSSSTVFFSVVQRSVLDVQEAGMT